MGNPKEASTTSLIDDDDLLPPYQETCDDAYSSNAASSSDPAPSYELSPQAGPSSGIQHKFPPSFNVYFQMKFTKTFYLALKKGEPLFAIRMHSGFTKNPELVLYDGPSGKGPILATANYKSTFSSASILTIPAHEGIGHDTESQRIQMDCDYNTAHNYRFSAIVGRGEKAHCEEFEWRSSHGQEVRGLDGYKWGRKLVRLSSHPVGGGKDRETRALGTSSDGHEVIAAWAYNNSWSLSKALKFQFMGSALTGALGDRGMTLAVISALRILFIEYSQSVASA